MNIIDEYKLYVGRAFGAPSTIRHGNAEQFGQAYIGSNMYRKNQIKRKRAQKK